MSSPVILAVKCNNCQTKYPNLWVTKNDKGFPSLEGIICQTCGQSNRLTRDWSDQYVNGIVPPSEDGQIHRFEYEYRNEDGKKVTGKIRSDHVQKHFEYHSKKRKQA